MSSKPEALNIFMDEKAFSNFPIDKLLLPQPVSKDWVLATN